MAIIDPDKLVTPKFIIHTNKNDAKSKEAGRPIYEDMEAVEVRFAGDRQKISVFPAHAYCGQFQNEDGDYEQVTYAQRWSKQYGRFKAKEQQVAEGTPIDELPFLTQAKRSELKALNVYTAEALAALDGQSLKNIGPGGRELKNQAQAYLDRASGSANVTKMAADMEDMRQTISALQAELQGKAPATPEADTVDDTESPFAGWSADQLKDWIQEKSGSRPRGNPGVATLVKQADEINAGLAGQAAA